MKTVRPAGCRPVSGPSKARSCVSTPAEEIVACYPDDLDRFIGPETRVVAVSTHNPLGMTFAAGVYTSMFGSSRDPINSHYSKQLFASIKENPHRESFRVIVGGSGGWQIVETGSFEELGVDCVVEGRAESADTMALIEQALQGQPVPRKLVVAHPKQRDALQLPEKRTTFGVRGNDNRLREALPVLRA